MSEASVRPGALTRLRLALLVLFATFGGTACQSWSEEYWSFPMTRRAYVRQTMQGWGETHPGDPGTDPDHPGYSGGEEQLGELTFLLFVPILVDLLILPVTAVHDLLILD